MRSPADTTLSTSDRAATRSGPRPPRRAPAGPPPWRDRRGARQVATAPSSSPNVT